ncbi:MAG: peptidoglycan DD-metalloendopeptidase family protein [Acidimicrobiia bacterium]|nr:peptidoglycan DD-metalloendopeptidase family protein [Acidimicrobiia bacterium]
MRRLTRSAVRLTLVVAVLFPAAAAVEVAPLQAASDPQTAALPERELYPLVFPVDGQYSFTDTFGAPREGNRLHQGIDIFADKLTPVVAVADGTIIKVTIGERAGRYIVVEHDDGWRSYYIHLNNDSPGTDDGLRNESPAGISKGARVEAGELLDYVGDSGNAESTPAHLHFELHAPDGIVVNPYPHLLAATGAPADRVQSAFESAYGDLPDAEAITVVGSFDPGDGFAAGVWVHADIAYMGTWGRPQACPASGVRLLDVTKPVEPELIGAIATGEEYPESDTDSVWAGDVDTDAFTGDVAVVAVSLCDNSERNRFREAFRGLAIYDVTDPNNPAPLAEYHSGDRTQGVHELDVITRADGRVLAAATVMQSLPHTAGARGDVRLIDITDPANPFETADWDFRSDAPAASEWLRAVDEEQLHAHGVAFDESGNRLWVAVWDAGAVMLDVTDPAQPKIAQSVEEVASAEGNVHTVATSSELGLMVLSSEDLWPVDRPSHVAGWGYQRIFDLTGEPLADFVAGDDDHAADNPVPLDGFHTAHNAQLLEGRLYSSWYSSGVRVVDVSDPTNPLEIGHFVPPPTRDPQAYWIAPDGTARLAMVWDVRVVDDLIYATDMNTGLWILRYVGDDAARFERYQ